MAGNTVPSRSVVTPDFRFSYCALIKPRAYQEGGQAKGTPAYQTEAIFPESSLPNFRVYDETAKTYTNVNITALLSQLAQEAWPGQDIKAIFERQLDKHGNPGKGWPLKRGDLIAVGMRVMSFKSYESDKMQPPQLSTVTDPKLNKFRPLDRLNDEDMKLANQLFRGGNWGFATINIRAKITSGMYAITPYLNGIRYTRQDAQIGGQSEMDRFDGVSGGQSPHDPTKGMDDDIPF
jgi:hypothetical protein